MKPRVLKPGDVVQIRLEVTRNGFQGCFLLVTRMKPWGVEGHVNVPWYLITPAGIGSPDGSWKCHGCHRIVLRLRWDEMEYVGRAAWVPADDVPGTEEHVP